MLFALCLHADAQQPGKISRIGFLDRGTAASAVHLDAFRQELNKLGWIERKSITIEYRFAEGNTERLPQLAAELVRLKVDLIVATGSEPTFAAKRATTSIPIVMTSFPDPVGEGVIASLARPGGNVTGFSSLTSELNSKRLEILKDVVPRLARVGVLRQAGTPVRGDLRLSNLRAAAAVLKLKLEEIETRARRQRFRECLSRPQSRSRSTRLSSVADAYFLPKESKSSSLPSNTGCRLFTHMRSLPMMAVSCPMGRTTLISFGARLFTSTRS